MSVIEEATAGSAIAVSVESAKVGSIGRRGGLMRSIPPMADAAATARLTMGRLHAERIIVSLCIEADTA
jgi:hypothetical protein